MRATIAARVVSLSSSVRSPPAIDGDSAPGDPRRSVRTQEGNIRRYFSGLHQPVDRRFGDHDLLDHLRFGDTVDPRLIGDLLLNERGTDVGGAHAVAGHAIASA